MLEKFIRFTAVAVLAFATTGAGAEPDIASGEYFNQPYLAGIKVVPAWNAGLLGAGFIIADLDSGVRATHVDLLGRIAPGGYDFVNDDDDPDDDETSTTFGHGTASAGVIVGNWNGVGSRAWDGSAWDWDGVTAAGGAAGSQRGGGCGAH